MLNDLLNGVVVVVDRELWSQGLDLSNDTVSKAHEHV
jgi:hypothetical protein